MTTTRDGARFFQPPQNWASLSEDEQKAWCEEVADALMGETPASGEESATSEGDQKGP